MMPAKTPHVVEVVASIVHGVLNRLGWHLKSLRQMLYKPVGALEMAFAKSLKSPQPFGHVLVAVAPDQFDRG